MIALPPAIQSVLLRQTLLLCGLLLAAFAVALVLGAILVIARQPPPAIAPAPSTLAAASIELPVIPLSENAGEMLARPLFWSTRRPEPEAGPAEDAPAPQLGPDVLDNVLVLGVFAAGDSAGVIISVAGQRQRLMVGEELQQWTLQGSSAAGATFVATDDTSVERLVALEHARVKAVSLPAAQTQAAGTTDDSPERIIKAVE